MSRTLLAVEDSRTMRKVLEITFAEGDFEAILVDSAQAALERLETLAPEAALLDVTLPDLNGYELCRQLKGRDPGLSVIMLSSTQQPYDPLHGAEVHADDFIDKPFDSQALLDKLREVLQRRGASAAPARASAAPAEQHPSFSAPRGDSVAPRARQLSATAPPPPPPPVVGSSALALETGWAARLEALGLTAQQVDAVTALSHEVIEKVVWEVVPPLAETLIKEEIARLTRE